MEIVNHWTYYLPEAGTIVKKGERQLALLSRIVALQEQLEGLQQQYDEEESRLVQLASDQWTLDEIRTAQLHAKQESNETIL